MKLVNPAMKKNKISAPNCNCSICRNMLPFEFPLEVIEAAKAENLVIFAGAGISTESKHVFKTTLYEDLCDRLGIKEGEEKDFPDLVSRFCRQSNGRIHFLQLLRSRFDYVHQYPELFQLATRFHEELAPLWMIKTIITTNWDDYFERVCGAIPIVTAQDFAFYGLPERKVFKIHGSINNYGSIVASNEDYQKCYKELKSGVIGSCLKTILATKTVLFVGYSFRDFNFNKIYSFLREELKDILPKSFVITLDDPQDTKFRKLNSTIIQTDATYFLSVLRQHLVDKHYVMDGSIFEFIMALRFHLSNYQKAFVLKNRNMVDFPGLIYTVAYQNGLMHGLDYLLHNSKSGKSYDGLSIHPLIKRYNHEARPEFMKVGAYYDVSYVDGYVRGLMGLFGNDNSVFKDVPYLYLYGIGEIDNEKEFNKRLKNYEFEHKTAHLHARKFVKLMGNDPDIILSHRPFL